MADKVYSCAYCATTVIKATAPGQSGCTVKSSHYWKILGNAGNNSYQCRECNLVVTTTSTPAQGGCTKASSHYWKKV